MEGDLNMRFYEETKDVTNIMLPLEEGKLCLADNFALRFSHGAFMIALEKLVIGT